MRHIPNILSASRILLAAMFPWANHDQRLCLILLASITEFLDGYLARRFDWTSKLGTLLDPIADKVFILGVALTFFYESGHGILYPFFFMTRDIIVIIGAIAIAYKGLYTSFLNLRPSWLGKITTTLQLATLLHYAWFDHFNMILLWATWMFAFAATVEYRLLFDQKHMFQDPV